MLRYQRPRILYTLQETDEPNLLKDFFPSANPPRIFFDRKYIPPQPAENFYITDTTFRDGQQARVPYTPEQIETLYKFLHKLSGPKGIIRKTEFFLYTNKDREALERCLSLG